jgi:hypothetical protein
MVALSLQCGTINQECPDEQRCQHDRQQPAAGEAGAAQSDEQTAEQPAAALVRGVRRPLPQPEDAAQSEQDQQRIPDVGHPQPAVMEMEVGAAEQGGGDHGRHLPPHLPPQQIERRHRRRADKWERPGASPRRLSQQPHGNGVEVQRQQRIGQPAGAEGLSNCPLRMRTTSSPRLASIPLSTKGSRPRLISRSSSGMKKKAAAVSRVRRSGRGSGILGYGEVLRA